MRTSQCQWGKFGEAVPGLFFLRATFIVGNPLPAHKGQTVESALTLSPGLERPAKIPLLANIVMARIVIAQETKNQGCTLE